MAQVADAVLAGDLDDSSIPTEARALLRLTCEITEHADRITDRDLAAVRSHGWSEAQVLEAIWTACLFNAVVRLADTLGLHELGQLVKADDAG